jgi:hypothetical protein
MFRSLFRRRYAGPPPEPAPRLAVIRPERIEERLAPCRQLLDGAGRDTHADYRFLLEAANAAYAEATRRVCARLGIAELIAVGDGDLSPQGLADVTAEVIAELAGLECRATRAAA